MDYTQSPYYGQSELRRFKHNPPSLLQSMGYGPTNAHSEASSMTTGSDPATPSSAGAFASLYSEDFESQDWSLLAVPAPRKEQVSRQPIPSPPSIPQSANSQLIFEISDDEDELLANPTPPATERTTLNGKTLRPRASLSASAAKLGYSPHDDAPSPSRHSIPSRAKKIIRSDSRSPSASALSARNLVRMQIAQFTKAKRDRFLSNKASLFLPLLPEKNYIRNLGRMSDQVMAYQEIPQPKGLNAKLKPYQVKGLSFLVHMHNNGMPAILGDEMGLGKTLQTLSLFQYLTEKRLHSGDAPNQEIRPFLVICPLSVLENWVAEARKFTPKLRVLRFHGPAVAREFLKDELRKRKTQSSYTRELLRNGKHTHSKSEQAYDIVITTYEAFEAEAIWFKSVAAWRYVVLDEGHRIKNHKSKSSKSLQSLQAEYRLILTGTPLQNNLVEMWSLFHWLLPDVFTENTLQLFQSAFNLSKGHVNRAILDHSRRLLELIMLRRMKNASGVDLNLPPKKVVRLFVPLTEFQKKWYLQLLTQQSDDMLDEVFLNAQDQEKSIVQTSGTRHDSAVPMTEYEHATPRKSTKDPWRRLLNLVLQLRKVCTHAYLIDGAEPENQPIGPHIYQTSGKFAALHKLVSELVLRQGKKIIIFSNFVRVLDMVQELMTLMSSDGTAFETLRLDGNLVRAKRNLYIRLFQKDEPPYKVFLISTKAGGVGLNLTAATEVVFMDEDWNPQVDLQAEARCHRIGQTKPVTVYKLCTAGSVEEQMLGRIHKKLYLSAKITEAMQNVHDSPNDAENLTIAEGQKLFGSFSEFKSLLRRGTRTLANTGPEANDLLSWDFPTMLDKLQRALPEGGDEVEDTTEGDWLATMEKVECAVFNGKRYERERTKWEDSETPPSTARSERRKGKEMTVMIDGFAINKESLACKDWESVPTLAGKDDALKNPKRMRESFQHQSHCQRCFGDDGPFVECPNCPRMYHESCLSKQEVQLARSFGNWNCSQHHCTQCDKRAAEAGGMIFRCRWCSHGYCEDCLNWDQTILVGDTISEYKVLRFPVRREAYYVICEECNVPGCADELEGMAREWERVAEQMEMERDERPDRGGIVKTVEEQVGDLKKTSNITTSTPSLRTAPSSAEPSTIPTTPKNAFLGVEQNLLAASTPAKRKAGFVSGSATKKSKQKRYYEMED